MVTAATLIAALGAGLVAGVFLAFSSFVMRALARLPATQGIAAMNAINVTVINPLFLGTMFGTGVVGLLLAVHAIAGSDPVDPWRPAGGIIYAVGTIGVTMAFNVPRNNRLARVNGGDPGDATIWTDYVAGWTAWNHVRTVAALAAAACFTLALL